MATKLNNRCLQNAADDEPIFVLRAQDSLAPKVVRFWADLAELAHCPSDKIAEARTLADEMERWPIRHFPD